MIKNKSGIIEAIGHRPMAFLMDADPGLLKPDRI